MRRLNKGFHFLGVDFEVTRIPQSETQVKTQVTIHSRTCRRALDKVSAMKADAARESIKAPAKIQRYLKRWATWWDPVTKLGYWSILQKWGDHTTADQPAVVWLGRGLLPQSTLT